MRYLSVLAGADLCSQVMKKKTEADKLCLQMEGLPFGVALKSELDKFSERFESRAWELNADVLFLGCELKAVVLIFGL